jgi:hypothetical protein
VVGAARTRVIAVRRARKISGEQFMDAKCCVPVRAAHAKYLQALAVEVHAGDFENATKDFDNAIIAQKTKEQDRVDEVPQAAGGERC